MNPTEFNWKHDTGLIFRLNSLVKVHKVKAYQALATPVLGSEIIILMYSVGFLFPSFNSHLLDCCWNETFFQLIYFECGE